MQKETKTKMLFFVILVGSLSMFTAVVTDHWAVLSPQVEKVNTTCEAAHFGLWRLCKKHIYIEDGEYIGKGCGPISLPGVISSSRQKEGCLLPLASSVATGYTYRDCCPTSSYPKHLCTLANPAEPSKGLFTLIHRVSLWGSIPQGSEPIYLDPPIIAELQEIGSRTISGHHASLSSTWSLCSPKSPLNSSTTSSGTVYPTSMMPEINCSYFRHFTPGEDSEIFEVKTQRDYRRASILNFGRRAQVFDPVALSLEYNISAAAIAIFSLIFMLLGTLCVLGSLRKGKDYLYKPAGMFFAFAGLCAIISVEVMRQSVKRMIESEDTIWIEYYYSWSFACACTGFVLLLLSGIGLLLVSMPHMPRNPWETCMDAEPENM
ncbi:hypothetical protein DNTS_013295 [Danionella cerebrum]|uniref:Voltage-dependent calcium channel gamma-1 subunit n=1 Tax=Danionella cerebrum TaxID=2873325 RepID=A0A553PWP8_9TELE|nr:hypothetical protein DNTS_013295 [Danionella translucida]